MLEMEISDVEKDLIIHGYNVEQIAREISKEMHLSTWEKNLISLCSNLHDYGKLDIPTEILYKPGKLTASEYEVMKNHSIYGYKYMRSRGYSHNMAKIVELHHENVDGSGYPYGLTEDEIPLEAKIIRVADMYGSLREDRPWRSAHSVEEALKIMRKEAFKFNKTIYDALLKLVEEGTIE